MNSACEYEPYIKMWFVSALEDVSVSNEQRRAHKAVSAQQRAFGIVVCRLLRGEKLVPLDSERYAGWAAHEVFWFVKVSDKGILALQTQCIVDNDSAVIVVAYDPQRKIKRIKSKC